MNTAGTLGLVFAALGAVGLVWGVTLYNGLVRLRNDIERAWANIDVLLRQRADEIPNLVEVCRGYARHEREVLDAVLRARDALHTAGGDPAACNAAQQSLNDALANLYGVVEAYPALRADRAFDRLQRRITAIEDEIADRRELFNASVMRYNTRIEQFPEATFARLARLRRRPLFTAEARARRLPPA